MMLRTLITKLILCQCLIWVPTIITLKYLTSWDPIDKLALMFLCTMIGLLITITSILDYEPSVNTITGTLTESKHD